MKILSFIGYSGSGKTHQIINLIKLMDLYFDYNLVIIKNIHEHQIDKEGKDTFRYSENGALLAITKNVYNETAIFIKKELSLTNLLNWMETAPFKVDMCVTEGFRNLNYPTVLCVENPSQVDEQLTDNVLMISGIICNKSTGPIQLRGNLSCIDIEKEFKEFLKIFNLP